MQAGRSGRRAFWTGAALSLVALTGPLAALPTATAQAAELGGTATPKTVVQVVTRTPTGSTMPVKMLATTKGASLYFGPSTGCTGGCLTVWPPLEIGKGKIPKGVKGLGTTSVTVGTKTHRQVTCHGKPLYTFIDDSGTSVNGNGVGGFTVAMVTPKATK